jgi:hypothetical protein
LAAAKALHDWVRSRIRYVLDPVDVETVQDPEATLKIKAGDCDDHSALMAALAMSIGIPSRFVTLGNRRDNFQHIYPELLIAGRWYPADTTSSKPFGWAAKLPVKKIYSNKGVPAMSFSGLGTEVIPVTKAEVKGVAYKAALGVLKDNWNKGLINLQDVKGYLKVIDQGDSPYRGTVVDAPMRKAIQDFHDTIVRTGAKSDKPLGGLSGLEGLDGFLKSIVKAVGKAVGGVAKVVVGAAKAVVGGGGAPVTIKPTIQLPSGLIKTEVTPEAAKAGMAEILSSPIFLIGVGLIAVLLLTKRGRK